MSEEKIFSVAQEVAERALIDKQAYLKMYAESTADPDHFWGEHGKRIDWIKPYSKVKNTHFGRDDVSIKWYEDGTLNACVNCVDRHLETRGEQTAIIWEGDDPNDSKLITYKELHEQVCKFSNGLKSLGAKIQRF